MSESYYVNDSYELEGYYDQIKPNFEQQQKQIVNENENGRANTSQRSTYILLVLVVIICIICFVLLLLTILMFEKINDRCNCVANEGQCRTLRFTSAGIENYRLKSHVIRTIDVINEDLCSTQCYLEPNCVSYNFKKEKEASGQHKCDLNNDTQQAGDLEKNDTYVYRGAQNSCANKPCKNNATCQAGFTDKDYQCLCIPGFTGHDCDVVQSCSDLKNLDPSATDGNYTIDPDGEGSLEPFSVFCDMSDQNGVGVTVVSHDSESRTHVQGYEGHGRYSREIHYIGASLLQLASLTRVSSNCEQFIKYECHHSMLFSQRYAWWESRDSSKMTYWGGASPGSGKCACGMNNSCANPSYGCNCDANDKVWREDSGLLTDKSHLPVTQLRFGDTGDTKHEEEGYHTLGKLKCYGRA